MARFLSRLWLLALFAAVLATSLWLADSPGKIVINWRGWHIETSLALIVALAGVVMLVLFAMGRIWSWAKAGHPMAGPRRKLRRSRLGLRDVDQALVALAAGDIARARKHANHAVARLEGAAIAHVVAAQAASSAGDDAAAKKHFHALRDNPDSKFLGLRGLITQARREGHRSEALALTDAARETMPRSPWAVGTGFDLESANGEWEKARATLHQALALKSIDPQTAARHHAVLLYGQAVEAEAERNFPQALKLALEAHKKAPDFPPSALLAARLLKTAGKITRAARVIEHTWARQPHPSLAESYASLEPTETAQARLKRFERLAAQNPNHPESRLRLAEAALGAGEADKARESLIPLTSGVPRARVGRLMLQIEAAQGGDAQSRSHWADIAASGAGEPVWSCSSCGAERARWTPHCPQCGQFNSLNWNQQPSRGPIEGGDMIALVGGARPTPKLTGPSTVSQVPPKR